MLLKVNLHCTIVQNRHSVSSLIKNFDCVCLWITLECVCYSSLIAPPTVPTPPTQLSAANTTNSAKLQVTWQRPECDNGVLLGYTVSQHITLSETINFRR